MWHDWHEANSSVREGLTNLRKTSATKVASEPLGFLRHEKRGTREAVKFRKPRRHCRPSTMRRKTTRAHFVCPRAVTLLSVRGRGARRFFDSAPRVSQPGDGLLAVLFSPKRGPRRFPSSTRQRRRARVRVCACVRNCQITTCVDYRRRRRTTYFIGDLGARTRLSRAKDASAKREGGKERGRDKRRNSRTNRQTLAAKMRKARDARDRQVTRSR